MRAKSNEKPYNRNYLYKAGLLTSMYPDSKPNPNLNQNYKQFANVQSSNLFSGNSKAKCKILPLSSNLKGKGLPQRSRSPKIPNTFTKYSQILHIPKTEVTNVSPNTIALTERPATSLNDFNYNVDSAQFSSFGGYNQNQGVEVRKSLEELGERNEDNFYLSDLDIIDIALGMNDNMNQNTIINYETNNLTKKETKKVEKNPFEYNQDILINEYTNNQNNQFSTNEGGFNTYYESIIPKNDAQLNQPVSEYQPQIPLKENELTIVQSKPSTTNDIYGEYIKSDYNYNYNFNSPFEIKDNNSFEMPNTKIAKEPSLSQKPINIEDNIRYSILESTHNEQNDLENIYIIAEAEMLEQEKKKLGNH